MIALGVYIQPFWKFFRSAPGGLRGGRKRGFFHTKTGSMTSKVSINWEFDDECDGGYPTEGQGAKKISIDPSRGAPRGPKLRISKKSQYIASRVSKCKEI